MNTATELAMAVMAIPVTALAIGWLLGRNTEPPLIDPEEYEKWGVE
jgi:ABC-type Fe3+ transport system permease subunit